MDVSVLCPTRERPHMVRRLVKSALETAARPPQFIFYIDDDDPRRTDYDRLLEGFRLNDDVDVWMLMRPRIVMSDMWNRCAERATGAILTFVDDEAIFHTHGWDALVVEEFERWPDRAVLVQPNDLVHDGADAGYYFVHHRWIEIFGRLTPPMFTYGYADVWPMEVARAAGRKIYRSDVVIENTAPKNQPPDHVHAANAVRYAGARCGDMYRETQLVREDEVRRLRLWIREGRTE